MKVAFDCDGTLKNYDGTLRKDVCKLMLAFSRTPGVELIVWSGGGRDYARSVVAQVTREFNLEEPINCIVLFKDKSMPDLVFDDEVVALGKVNVQLRPGQDD